MARFFILGFFLLPILEIAIFIKVGQTIGLLPTLGLVIGAAILGGLVLRQQGVSVLMQMRSNVSTGQMPAKAMAEAGMIGLAAVLLVLPGFFTDVLALALLLPPVRAWIYKGLAGRVSVVQTASYGGTRSQPNDPRISRPGTIDLDEDEFRPK